MDADVCSNHLKIKHKKDSLVLNLESTQQRERERKFSSFAFFSPSSQTYSRKRGQTILTVYCKSPTIIKLGTRQGKLTEVSPEVELSCSWAPLLVVNTAIRLGTETKLGVRLGEMVKTSWLIGFYVG